MKRMIAMFMVLVLAFACVACTGNNEPTEPTQPTQTEPTPAQSSEPEPQETVDNPVEYFTMSLANAEDDMDLLTAYMNENGECYVEYVGDEKRVGTFETDVFNGITLALQNSGLEALNGQSVYEEGAAFASIYVQYADGTYLMADYSGTIAQEFVDGFNAMDAYFQTLVADLPVYVPQPVIMGEVDADTLAAFTEILNGSGIKELDSLVISDVPVDEYFGAVAGLSSSEGIVSAASCDPMMMTTAYSCVIVTVDDAARIASVREDFADGLAWNKWVCVCANSAIIAQKDNMVLCLLGSGELYAQTKLAVENSGWTDVQQISNPDL